MGVKIFGPQHQTILRDSILAIQGEPMANNDDWRLTIMTEIANKLQSLKKQITGDKKLLGDSAKVNLLEYQHLVGKIEDVEKALKAKKEEIANKQISPKSQIQRYSQRC